MPFLHINVYISTSKITGLILEHTPIISCKFSMGEKKETEIILMGFNQDTEKIRILNGKCRDSTKYCKIKRSQIITAHIHLEFFFFKF